MHIEFYTTHCPQCKGVKMMLDRKNIQYTEIIGEEPIKNLGLSSAPVLVVDGKIHQGKDIFNWIQNQNSDN